MFICRYLSKNVFWPPRDFGNIYIYQRSILRPCVYVSQMDRVEHSISLNRHAATSIV